MFICFVLGNINICVYLSVQCTLCTLYVYVHCIGTFYMCPLCICNVYILRTMYTVYHVCTLHVYTAYNVYYMYIVCMCVHCLCLGVCMHVCLCVFKCVYTVYVHCVCLCDVYVHTCVCMFKCCVYV